MSLTEKMLGKPRRVMLVDPKDLTYRDIPITREESRGFVTRKVENLITHYWKGGPGWTGNHVRYIGTRGYTLTSWIKETGEVVEGSVKEFLEFVWGADTYEKLKPELREPIERNIGVIVTVKPDLAKDQDARYMISRLDAEAMLQDTTNENLGNLGLPEEKKAWTQSLGEKIPWIAVGLALNYVLLQLGIFSP